MPVEISIEADGHNRYRLLIHNDGIFIGEYERSQEDQLYRKKQEILRAAGYLLEVYNKHHLPFVVRWKRPNKEIRITKDGIEPMVYIIPNEYWRGVNNGMDHETLYQIMRARGLKGEANGVKEYCLFWKQIPNCAVLYKPGDFDTAPVWLREDTDSWNSKYGELIKVCLVHQGKSGKFLTYNVPDWNYLYLAFLKISNGNAESKIITLPPTITKSKDDAMETFNSILYGPPGTGKTYNTARSAVKKIDDSAEDDRDALMDRYRELLIQTNELNIITSGQIAFVTFHQSYSYEDFVEGIRPVTNEGAVTYEIRQGIFRQMCARAEEDTENKYVLIIDEINRANISKVFGELITLLEPDKRIDEANEIKVRLPYSGEEFGIPPNLYLIGTMNTADRSIALLDTALRRRFEFVEMMPKPELLGTVESIDLAALLIALNKRVEYLYDRDHTIGHAFFMHVKTLNDLNAVFRRKVIPLLQEYFYEDWKKITQVLNDSGETQYFLRIEELPAPRMSAQDNGYGEARKRYSVNDSFTVAAFRNLYAD